MIRSDTIVSAEQYMTKRTTPRILFLLPALLFAADSSGVRPRDDRSRDTISASVPKAIEELSETPKPVATELEAKCLPETSTDKPVAGYLYFPVRDKKDGDNEYELEYKAQRTWMILPLHAGTLR